MTCVPSEDSDQPDINLVWSVSLLFEWSKTEHLATQYVHSNNFDIGPGGHCKIKWPCE